jgi:hypothetical protein
MESSVPEASIRQTLEELQPSFYPKEYLIKAVSGEYYAMVIYYERVSYFVVQ